MPTGNEWGVCERLCVCAWAVGTHLQPCNRQEWVGVHIIRGNVDCWLFLLLVSLPVRKRALNKCMCFNVVCFHYVLNYVLLETWCFSHLTYFNVKNIYSWGRGTFSILNGSCNIHIANMLTGNRVLFILYIGCIQGLRPGLVLLQEWVRLQFIRLGLKLFKALLCRILPPECPPPTLYSPSLSFRVCIRAYSGLQVPVPSFQLLSFTLSCFFCDK